MFVAFGEIMMRVAPAGHLRLRQVMPGEVEVTFAGAEANVCASLANFGAPARFVTALPSNPLADAVIADLRGLGIDTRFMLRSAEGRLGIYFVETGANQRSSTVIYDRDHSAISLANTAEYDFNGALADAKWLHITGITPSLSERAYEATLAIVQLAKQRGIPVSCDLNFRKKLWRWRSGVAANLLARECMSEILKFVDLAIANEEDAADVLDIHAEGTNIEGGQINAAGYEQVARKMIAKFPNLSRVAFTLRESYSADHNNWGGLLFDRQSDRAYLAPLDANGAYRPYEIRDIVDRVGGGDSFGAGLMFALNQPGATDPQRALHFGVAASCLKHSIRGDFNFVTREEVEALVGGAASGRVRR
ncbi:MAG: sugar kinase [Planctomycetaceae bacterium]|nr:sugar kinase [Planctomycetaceae bacterium]